MEYLKSKYNIIITNKNDINFLLNNIDINKLYKFINKFGKIEYGFIKTQPYPIIYNKNEYGIYEYKLINLYDFYFNNYYINKNKIDDELYQDIINDIKFLNNDTNLEFIESYKIYNFTSINVLILIYDSNILIFIKDNIKLKKYKDYIEKIQNTFILIDNYINKYL